MASIPSFLKTLQGVLNISTQAIPCDFKFPRETSEYNACSFTLENKNIIYRKAKLTPKKVGLFVAIWERDEDGQTRPYSNDDDFDFLLIDIDSPSIKGFFLYPKNTLIELNIISSEQTQGKRGMRVYPTAEDNMNKQATKTYKSHLPYFHTVENN
ncbi:MULTISPECIES: MepB family protein [Myroides]|uniref:MepB protein n=1 Tax=Myroides albus TaxID=2562892 RepID=A0A6I3LMQ4_9FLAO|nr:MULTISPECIES: MepB family protein [Myroides]MTG98997.1 hypothetical protein [Myroides albus]MVX35769.1 hypothetical protein [Myroides sp. LoEW2-1]UVD78251.1 MepB family protein [Myroides albus]